MADENAKFLQQARTLSDEEVANYCTVLNVALSQTEKLQDCLTGLRHIYLVQLVSDKVRLTPELINQLSKLLLEQKFENYGLACLIEAVLSHVSNLPAIPSDVNDTNIPLLLSLSATQNVQGENVKDLIPQLVRWISSVGYSASTQAAALAFITTIAVLDRQKLKKEQIHIVNCQLLEWLHKASIVQAINPQKKGFFSKSEQNDLVTEMDGSVVRDFFTVLNISKYYSADQLLNIHSFSSLYGWLKNTSIDTEDEGDSSQLAEAQELLKEKTISYCLRIIDQADRKPKVPEDAEIQIAAVYEAINILDFICSSDSRLITRSIQAIKKLYKTLSQGPDASRLYVVIIKFVLNNAEVVVFDPTMYYNDFFDTILALNYKNAGVAFDTIQLINDNLLKFCSKTDVLSLYFPNILKILAWNPMYIQEFLEMIPAMIDRNTAIEVFHCLLDLPCVTAAMETEILVSKTSEPPPMFITSTEAYSNPLYRPLFNFIMRNSSGMGDTIDRLGHLHSYLADWKNHPRVLNCCSIVPDLLREFLKTVIEDGDCDLVCRLVPVIIDRVGLLYKNQRYVNEVQTILANGFVDCLRKYPTMFMDINSDISDYISNPRSVLNAEDFYVHVVCAIGTYVSSSMDARFKSETITKYYETLECQAYEISGILVSTEPDVTPMYTIRLLACILTALAKLASRCQDLIPRAMLCLNKVGQQFRDRQIDDNEVLSHRADTLINLLKLPNVANAVLSPSKELQTLRCHLDNNSTPVLLQTISKLVHGPS